MRIRASLLILLSIIFNIILISTRFNAIYIFTLILLVFAEGVLICDVVKQVKENIETDMLAPKDLTIITVAASLGYDIRFEGKTTIFVNLYYENEFITSLMRKDDDARFYIINGLFNSFERDKTIGVIDVESLIMRLCEYKTNPEEYRRGENKYELANLME